MDDVSLLDKGPNRPGRPMELGNTAWKKNDQTEISNFKEESSIRFHLGYCMCGRQIVAGYNRMNLLMDRLEKAHFPRRRERRPPLRHVLGKMLMSNDYPH